MEIHYTKHYTAYIKNVNAPIVAAGINVKNEHEFFARASKLSPNARNNGGGAWNHISFGIPYAPEKKMAIRQT